MEYFSLLKRYLKVCVVSVIYSSHFQLYKMCHTLGFAYPSGSGLLKPCLCFLGDVRFRVETDVAGLGPPLYEQQSLVEVEISQGQRVVMETGRPPNSTQVGYIHALYIQ